MVVGGSALGSVLAGAALFLGGMVVVELVGVVFGPGLGGEVDHRWFYSDAI